MSGSLLCRGDGAGYAVHYQDKVQQTAEKTSWTEVGHTRHNSNQARYTQLNSEAEKTRNAALRKLDDDTASRLCQFKKKEFFFKTNKEKQENLIKLNEDM